jgi:tetraacyldisaccharide 4'-kinase
VFPFLSEVCEPDFLKGKRVLAFAGIARPDAFKETLLKLGAEIAYFRSFSDHYQFNRTEIEALIEMKDSLRARYILTSEKDWVRMASITPSCPQIAYLSIKFVMISDQGGFYSMVRSALN